MDVGEVGAGMSLEDSVMAEWYSGLLCLSVATNNVVRFRWVLEKLELMNDNR